MITINSQVLSETSCCVCGIIFAVPQDWLANKKNHGNGFYCPNGHSLTFGKSKVDELKEKLEAVERDLRAAKCNILTERQLKEAEAKKRESAEAKLRRVSKGVCPCCKRSFSNLQRHMASKHPGEKAEAA